LYPDIKLFNFEDVDKTIVSDKNNKKNNKKIIKKINYHKNINHYKKKIDSDNLSKSSESSETSESSGSSRTSKSSSCSKETTSTNTPIISRINSKIIRNNIKKLPIYKKTNKNIKKKINYIKSSELDEKDFTILRKFNL
jgi:hypothetical protein